MKAMLQKYRWQLLILLLSSPYLVLKAMGGGDFRILLTGAKYLRSGLSPYGVIMPIGPGISDVFLYSPFVGIVVAPLTYLPEFFCLLCFSFLNMLLLIRTSEIIIDCLDIKKLSGIMQKWWFALTLLFVIRFVLHNFEKMQMNVVVLYLSLEGLYQIILKQKMRGTILLAIGVCLKILPIVFLPYLIYKRKIKESIVMVIAIAVLLFIPTLVFGLQFNLSLLSGWWDAINPALAKYNSQQNDALFHGVYFQCISSLIPVYFSDMSYKNFSANLMSLNPQQLFWLINAIRAAPVLFTIYFLIKSAKAKDGNRKLFFFWETAYIFMIIPLIFPHQQKYSYINLLPVFAYLIYYLLRKYSHKDPRSKTEVRVLSIILGFSLILTFFTNDLFWGVEIGRVFQYLKLIVIGTIPLIPALAYFSPDKIEPDTGTNSR